MLSILNFFELFYPNICVVCDEHLLPSEELLCTFCRHDLPLIDECNYKENQISKIFYGRVPIEKAMSFMYYRKKGKAKTMIHQLKYKGNQEVGVFLGNWFGHQLNESKQFKDVDFIIPVPLHPSKLKIRGYNQLTTFGKTLEKILKTSYLENVLIRTNRSKTQTFKHRFERFSNSETKFLVKNSELLVNKHVLLIDDVITTGATLEACANELLKSDGIKISIVTMAFTE